MHESEVEVKIDTQVILTRGSFKYRDSIMIIQGYGKIDSIMIIQGCHTPYWSKVGEMDALVQGTVG